MEVLDRGYNRALLNVGNCYFEGTGVKADTLLAIKYWRESIEKTHDRVTLYNLGKTYFYGFGLNIDKKEGMQLIKQSANQGYAPAEFQMGKIYYLGAVVPVDYRKALKWFTKASEQKYGPGGK
jgi:TPR repeat protein